MPDLLVYDPDAAAWELTLPPGAVAEADLVTALSGGRMVPVDYIDTVEVAVRTGNVTRYAYFPRLWVEREWASSMFRYCPSCNLGLRLGQLVCGQCEYLNVCVRCDSGVQAIIHGSVCANCVRYCSYCDDPFTPDLDASMCNSCYGSLSECDRCEQRVYREDLREGDEGQLYCYSCARTAWCRYCDEFVGDETCDCRSNSESEDDSPEVLNNPGPVSANMLGFEPRPFNPDRGAMTMGYEMEFANEPTNVSYRLYQAGRSATSGLVNYSSRVSADAAVKTDASVSGGGELVTRVLTMPEDADTLWATFSCLRAAVKAGENDLDNRCGLHVHVGGQGLSTDAVMSAVATFNYLEDVLYRIAAAKWKRHRAMGGNSYTRCTPKVFDKARFRNSFGDRYYGLNISNYISNRFDCGCGVGFDNGHLCTCGAGSKNTLEFRLWNPTTNPIKMHAYCALSMALVAYGKGRSMVPDDMPHMEFTRTAIDNEQSSGEPQYSAQQYADRVVWMFQNLPLSAEERNSIRYCLRNCEIGPYLEAAAGRGEIEEALVHGVLHDDEVIDVPESIPVLEEPLAPEPEPQPVRSIVDAYGMDERWDDPCFIWDYIVTDEGRVWELTPQGHQQQAGFVQRDGYINSACRHGQCSDYTCCWRRTGLRWDQQARRFRLDGRFASTPPGNVYIPPALRTRQPILEWRNSATQAWGQEYPAAWPSLSTINVAAVRQSERVPF